MPDQKLGLQRMAKQLRFKEAALQAQEAAAAKEEGEMQAMLFAMLQDQHSDKQGQYGGHDGQNECPRCIECHQVNAPTGQGEYSSGRQRQTPRRRQSSEEAQEEKDDMPQL